MELFIPYANVNVTFRGSSADKEYDVTDDLSYQGYRIHFLWSKDILFVCLFL